MPHFTTNLRTTLRWPSASWNVLKEWQSSTSEIYGLLSLFFLQRTLVSDKILHKTKTYKIGNQGTFGCKGGGLKLSLEPETFANTKYKSLPWKESGLGNQEQWVLQGPVRI